MATIDRHQRARQVYRFRNHLLETHKTSPKLKRIEEADPGFEYLKALHWDDDPSEADSELKWLEAWELSPDGPGQFGSWLGTSFKKWRQDWVKGGKLPVPRPSQPQDKEDSEQQPAPSDDAPEDTVNHDHTGSVGEKEAHNDPQPTQDPPAATPVRDGDAPQNTPSDGPSSDVKGKQVNEGSGASRQSFAGTSAGSQPARELVTNDGRISSSFGMLNESANTINNSSPQAYVNPQSYPIQPAPSNTSAFPSRPKMTNNVTGSPRARPQPPVSQQPSQISFGPRATKFNTELSRPEPQPARAHSASNATFGCEPMTTGNGFGNTQVEMQPSQRQLESNVSTPARPVSPRPTTSNIFWAAQAQKQTSRIQSAPMTSNNPSGPSQAQWEASPAQAFFGSGATVTGNISESSLTQTQPSQHQPPSQTGFGSGVITSSNMFRSTQGELHPLQFQPTTMATNNVYESSRIQPQLSEIEPRLFRGTPATMATNNVPGSWPTQHQPLQAKTSFGPGIMPADNVSGSCRAEPHPPPADQAPQTSSSSHDAQRKVAYHLKQKVTVDGSASASVSSQQIYTDEELRDIYDFYRQVYRPKKRSERERDGQQ